MKLLRPPALACAVLLLLSALPAPSQAQSPATAALTAFEARWTSVAGYSATVDLFERAGANVQNSTLAYTFRKPSEATINFVAGDNSGVTMTWSGGPTVVAHRGGLMALFKKTFPLRDPQVTTIRGSSIDQLSFAAIIDHANDTPGIVSETPGPTVLGVPTAELTLVPTTPATDTGFTREVMDISTTSNLPVRIQGYEGDVLVRELDFSNIDIHAR